jgi:hypothetical protein
MSSISLMQWFDPSVLVGGREAGGKSIPADRRLARIEKHDIVRHQAEQAD